MSSFDGEKRIVGQQLFDIPNTECQIAGFSKCTLHIALIFLM